MATLIDKIAQAPLLPTPAERVALRQQLGIRQVDIARELGVSTQTVWAWEQGRSKPTGARRARYVELLDAMRTRAAQSALHHDDAE